MKLAASLAVLSAAYLFAPPLFAQTASPSTTTAQPTGPDKKESKDHFAYVSISPIHLLFPIVEVTGEFRLHEKIGLAAIGAVGSVNPYQFSQTQPPPGVSTSRFLVWEAGGQLVTYPVGHFDHGMQLGAEVLYLGVSGSASTSTETANATAQGLALSPFIGYKFTAPIGFSFNIQGGLTYYAVRADASSSTGETAQVTKESQFAPLINLNLGWAF